MRDYSPHEKAAKITSRWHFIGTLLSAAVSLWVGFYAGAARTDSLEEQIIELRQEQEEFVELLREERARNSNLEEEIRRLGGSSEPQEPRPAEQSPGEETLRAVSTQSQQKTVNNFRFELNGCELSGTQATCSFVVTNTREDFKMRLYANNIYKSRLFDNRGREYVASEGRIGESSGRSVNKLMITGIPMDGELRFTGLDADAEAVSVLQIFCDIPRHRGAVEFRNIPFQLR